MAVEAVAVEAHHVPDITAQGAMERTIATPILQSHVLHGEQTAMEGAVVAAVVVVAAVAAAQTATTRKQKNAETIVSSVAEPLHLALVLLGIPALQATLVLGRVWGVFMIPQNLPNAAITVFIQEKLWRSVLVLTIKRVRILLVQEEEPQGPIAEVQHRVRLVQQEPTVIARGEMHVQANCASLISIHHVLSKEDHGVLTNQEAVIHAAMLNMFALPAEKVVHRKPLPATLPVTLLG